MLHSVFYRGEFDEGEVEAVRAKIAVCARNLCESPIWKDISVLPPDCILSVDARDSVEIDGLSIYAAPDLVTRSPDGSCTLVDWKSGHRRHDDGALEQLALYAWFVERKLKIPFVESGWIGRAVYLQTGEEERHNLTRLDLMRAEHRIRESTEVMRRLLVEPEVNRPQPVEAFELVHPAFRFACGRCPFHRFCAPHFAAAQTSGRGTRR